MKAAGNSLVLICKCGDCTCVHICFILHSKKYYKTNLLDDPSCRSVTMNVMSFGTLPVTET